MRINKKLRRRVGAMLMMVSVLTWMLLLFNPGGWTSLEHCRVAMCGPVSPSMDLMWALNPFAHQALGWGLMLLAMMLPVVLLPVLHLMESSLPRRRLRSSFLFLLGYLGLWMVVGLLLLYPLMVARLYFVDSWLPVLTMGLIALIWQCSPLKQRCINRGHHHPVLPAFGKAADLAALCYGLNHGLWCLGSCWSLMILPMLFPVGHNLAMLLATVYMVSGHWEHPAIPAWKLRLVPRLIQIIWLQLTRRLEPGSSSI